MKFDKNLNTSSENLDDASLNNEEAKSLSKENFRNESNQENREKELQQITSSKLERQSKNNTEIQKDLEKQKTLIELDQLKESDIKLLESSKFNKHKNSSIDLIENNSQIGRNTQSLQVQGNLKELLENKKLDNLPFLKKIVKKALNLIS